VAPFTGAHHAFSRAGAPRFRGRSARTPPPSRPRGSAPDARAELLRRYGDWHDPIPAVLAAARPEDVLRHDVLAHHADDLAVHTAARLPRTTAIAGRAVQVARLNMTGNRAPMAVRDTAIAALSKARRALFLRGFERIADWRPPQQPYASGVTPAGNR
jgi:hypothetical protein